jgi:glutamate N-acetyltransferase/amino-acid N-acetyltransferase
MIKVSPFAPKNFPELPPIPGVRLGVGAIGPGSAGRPNLLLAELAEGTSVAGALTRSKTASAPVEWCRHVLGGGRARALLVNSGNANAFVGQAGRTAMERTIEATARQVSCAPERVFVASTGVIGEPLDAGPIIGALSALGGDLGSAGWEAAAGAIRTTDTYTKGATRNARIGGVDVTLNGIAKGAGMIAPDMATMLAFVFTDAELPAGVLHDLLKRAVAGSFNCITVDGDTSTSDTVLAFATGRAAHPPIASAGDARLRDFRRQLHDLCLDLAHQIVRDGEGATKFITISVTGATSAKAARRIGFAIANSPLVKTAFAGEDANWGRIVMAVGKSGEKADRDRLAISFGGVPVAEKGAAVAGYDEAPVARHMKGREIDIAVDVGVGRGRATVWTCDLTHGYIDIKADYRS